MCYVLINQSCCQEQLGSIRGFSLFKDKMKYRIQQKLVYYYHSDCHFQFAFHFRFLTLLLKSLRLSIYCLQGQVFFHLFCNLSF